MDIGGGSVEFIIADGDQMYWKGSYLLGAARMLDRFHKSDPISESEQAEYIKHLEKELAPLISEAKKHKVQVLVGSAGSFESIVDLIQEYLHKIIFDESESTYPVNIDDFEFIHNMLLKSTLEERRQMKGLVDYRVEMMVVSTIMIDFVLKELGLKQLMVTLYALKEGMLYEEAHRPIQNSASS
jgi:exopolyphosphatase/guanosine-5'-triphosphate,3'-diphosphate pyrophosphatase